MRPNSMPARKAGLISGTILLTQEGEIPVEFLSPGDRIITRDAGMVRLKTIRHRRLITRAISFAAGSLGHLRPDQDLVVPAAQMVLLRDWRAKAMFGSDHAMVRADALVDGEFVCDLGPQKMLLHQLGFDAPHVVYAGGLELSCMSEDAHELRPAA
jgi:Hint domain-containing protein